MSDADIRSDIVASADVSLASCYGNVDDMVILLELIFINAVALISQGFTVIDLLLAVCGNGQRRP